MKSITFSIIPWHLSSHYIIGKSARMHAFFGEVEKRLKNSDYLKNSASSKACGIKNNLAHSKCKMTFKFTFAFCYQKRDIFHTTFCIIWYAYIFISKNDFKIFYDLWALTPLFLPSKYPLTSAYYNPRWICVCCSLIFFFTPLIVHADLNL